MPDLDVIVKSLRRCSDMTICPDDCYYRKYAPDCIEKLHRDAINLLKDQNELLKQQAELLKEQEAVVQKTGHWIWLQFCANEGVYCSECHTKMFDRYPMKKKLSQFCGHCGAKMVDEVEGR